ncbi:MAG TPA: hypothetical protein VFK05_31455 [Polyangiaceae bacterium]|nr:hypothetical protein [Polyangiaceae bacterium]
MSAKVARPFGLASLAAALLGACYDMPLIPDDSPAVAGSAGHGSAGAGANANPHAGAGADARGGESAGGAPHASAGASNANGGSKPNGGGGASAGGVISSGGSAGAIGQAGSGGVPGITWLQLSGSKAPSSSTTNAALGIEGSFYAYGDGCSALVWDGSSRCASGMLCDPQQTLDNWGIAIGFDFRHTGAEGTPPYATLTWNPDDFKAHGVAWRVRGTAPKLQVWVLNMDPKWHGQCNVMSCEISGPPDGVSKAALNGELDFDNMVKDYWGGSGTEYTFDPAAVHALQFKIAAVEVGRVEFNFCIDALGIVQ